MPLRPALALSLAAALALAAVGCKTTEKVDTFSPDTGLPDESLIVGGGFSISYVAPADGTAIWANHANGQLLATYSLQKGEPVEISPDMADEDIRALFGNDLEDARPILYFVPQQ